MSYHSLHDLFISLPDHIKVHAVNEYIHELGKSGNLAEASKFFERLCTLTGHDTEKAHAAWYVIGLYLKQRQFEHAHSIYTILAKLEQTAAVEDIRAKAARIIIYSLLPETPSRALQVWLSLADGQLPVGVKWQVASIGLFLLEEAFRNSDIQMLDTVYQVLQKLRHAPHCKKIIEKADRIIQRKG